MAGLPVLYLITKILAVSTSYPMAGETLTDMVIIIISVLSFVCVFIFELLIDMHFNKKGNKVIILTVLATILATIIIGIDLLFPLCVVLLLHLFEITISKEMYFQVSIISCILLFILYKPDINNLILSLVLILMVLFSRIIIMKLKSYIDKNEVLKEKIIGLENQILDIKGLMKTLKTSASLEERNRIAARIHDEIGHGISGSIILLEAAMLQMKNDNNMDKAKSSVEKAIENLRESVDEIRTALREERTEKSLLGIQDLNLLLVEFKVKYNISTRFKNSGDLTKISYDKWACIHDNLKECLTNVLKHSNANEFTLDIKVFNKIIKVVYKDNGRSDKGFEKHLGLEAIEERTVNAQGKCFINKDVNGFSVINIFNY